MVATPPRPEREGWAAEINFPNFDFPFLFFVTIMAMFLKYLWHKVNLVGCFTFEF